MRAMQRRCELLMALRPGPPAYDEANPDPLRCCERETWSIHDYAFESVSLCTITVRKHVRPGDPCPGHIRARDAGMRRTTGQPGGSRAIPRNDHREPMRVVRVLAPVPDGEGEEIGIVETVIEARRIAASVGWCRAYRSSMDDPFFGAIHHVQDTVSLADSPLRCVRCDRILQPGTHYWRAYSEERDFGTACWDCEGAPGYMSRGPGPTPTA